MLTTVRVPASSANLGPGFDALGLAVGIYLECRFRSASSSHHSVRPRLRMIPTSADNLIWQTGVRGGAGRRWNAAADRVADPQRYSARQGPRVERGGIDRGRGDRRPVAGPGLEDASEFWMKRRGSKATPTMSPPACWARSSPARSIPAASRGRSGWNFTSASMSPSSSPDFMLPTRQARSVLPDCYSRADAIFNVQRAALLVAPRVRNDCGVSYRARGSLASALSAHSCPVSRRFCRLRAPGLLGCALSGAGPSIMVFYERGYEQVCDLVCQIFALHGRSTEVTPRPYRPRRVYRRKDRIGYLRPVYYPRCRYGGGDSIDSRNLCILLPASEPARLITSRVVPSGISRTRIPSRRPVPLPSRALLARHPPTKSRILAGSCVQRSNCFSTSGWYRSSSCFFA